LTNYFRTDTLAYLLVGSVKFQHIVRKQTQLATKVVVFECFVSTKKDFIFGEKATLETGLS